MNPELEQQITAYEAAPAELLAAVHGLNREQLRARPIAGKWSTHEVVCHLADFEPIFLDRVKRIIVEHEPTLFDGDENQFFARGNYDARETADELALIVACRKHLAPILKALAPEDFARRGNHSTAGIITLEALLRKINYHLPHHIAFIDEKRLALGLSRPA